jgi:heme-degrading monooxygenase HmoA
MDGLDLYTHHVWVVRSGREEEFVARWKDLAEWTAGNVRGAGTARLLQDMEHPGRFISVAPWESREALAAWRSQLGYQERLGRLRELLETFTPSTLAVRAQVEPPVAPTAAPAAAASGPGEAGSISRRKPGI